MRPWKMSSASRMRMFADQLSIRMAKDRIGAARHGSQLKFKPFGMADVVRILTGNPGSFRLTQADIQSGDDSRRRCQNAKAAIFVRGQNLERAIRAAPIDHEKFKILESLAQNAIHRLCQEPLCIPNRHEH